MASVGSQVASGWVVLWAAKPTERKRIKAELGVQRGLQPELMECTGVMSGCEPHGWQLLAGWAIV